MATRLEPGTALHLNPECADRPGDDPIFRLNAEARARAAQGESIVNATLGALMEDDGTLAVLPEVFAALERVPPGQAAGYAPIAGPAGFLDAVIADTYGDSPLAAQSIAVATPGGSGALQLGLVDFLRPGEAVLTTSFFWGPYRTLAEHTGRRVETFEMFGSDGRLDVGALARALDAQLGRQGRALVLLNTPCHNPTGYSLDDAEWQAVRDVLERAAERGPVTLLLDLAYARFGATGGPDWVACVAPLAGRVLLLVAWTASKAFAQYGARVGALIATTPDAGERQRIANALGYACRGTWSNCNHLGMLAVTELLSDPGCRARVDRQRERLRQLLGERVEAFVNAAAGAGLHHPRYEGGFFVTVFTADGSATAARMRELGVYVVPVNGAVRVALCSTPAAHVPRLVDALAESVVA